MYNVTRDGAIDYTKLRRVPSEKARLETFELRTGDVLFNATNSPDLVGKTALFVERDEPTVFSNHFLRIRTGDSLDPSFLSRFLQMHFARGTFRGMCRQWVNQATVSRDSVLGLKMPLPPLPEQCRVAAILDHADALRTKRREALTRLDELVQSIFIDMFGGALTRWPVVTVADVAGSDRGSMRTGPFGSQLLHEEFTDSGVAVLGIDNAVGNRFEWGERRYISEDKYEQLCRYTVRPGDVLITIMGTCGRCAVVPEGIPLAINTKHLCCITLDRGKALPEFLHSYFLLHPAAIRYLTQKAKGAIMSGLNMGIIKELPIPLVPIELQRKYVERTAHIESQRRDYRLGLAELDALFASLQSRAFRGEL
ncbi:restriction endonuclease subunit S [Rhodococcus sp. W8901]|nr:restriction endonuclease subunit S [Rhodococcus sp. W8901]